MPSSPHRSAAFALVTALLLSCAPRDVAIADSARGSGQTRVPVVHYHTLKVDGVDIFYREAGPVGAPTVLLLHGFPTSSHMFRNLIPVLADRYHVIAPDYPGFGESSAPNHEAFSYTFGHYANIVDGLLSQLDARKYAMYLMDYGAPVGYRLALKHPDRVTALIVQNGNAYEEGLKEFWDPIKAYWADGTNAHREALSFLVAPATQSSNTPTAYPTSPVSIRIIGPMTKRCWIVPATRTSNSTYSMTMGATFRFTLSFRRSFANGNHRR